jgi:hypothetical protein
MRDKMARGIVLTGANKKKTMRGQKKALMKFAGIWKDWKGAKEWEDQILRERRKNMGRKLNW